jgi:hypothetical protein
MRRWDALKLLLSSGLTAWSKLVFPDMFNATRRKLIIELAARYRLPAIYHFPDSRQKAMAPFV